VVNSIERPGDILVWMTSGRPVEGYPTGLSDVNLGHLRGPAEQAFEPSTLY
jgi:hypothetical protein